MSFDVKLSARMADDQSIQPEGIVLQLDDQSLYLDFIPGTAGKARYDMVSGTYQIDVKDAVLRDGKDGKPVDLFAYDLEDARVAGLDVRSEREQGLYIEPAGCELLQFDTADHLHTAKLGIAEQVSVRAWDAEGNDWSVSDHQPSVDELIADAQLRSAQSKQDNEKTRQPGRGD